jgi:cytochrome b561
LLRNSDEAWGSVARTLHWLVAAAILVQIPLGLAAVNWRLSPTKLDLFVLHKSLGLAILAVVAVRLAWRAVGTVPALPATMSVRERRAANASHALLYLAMLSVPISGWVASSAANVPFRWFWRVPVPVLAAPDEALAQLAGRVHLVLWIVLVVLVAVHVAAALWHHYVRRDDVLARMLPFGIGS